MTELVPKCVRLIPKETNLGLLKITFRNDIKSSKFVYSGCMWPTLFTIVISVIMRYIASDKSLQPDVTNQPPCRRPAPIPVTRHVTFRFKVAQIGWKSDKFWTLLKTSFQYILAWRVKMYIKLIFSIVLELSNFYTIWPTLSPNLLCLWGTSRTFSGWLHFRWTSVLYVLIQLATGFCKVVSFIIGPTLTPVN